MSIWIRKMNRGARRYRSYTQLCDEIPERAPSDRPLHCRLTAGCSEPHNPNAGEAMDFIERIFGVAPDGGSGSLEFLLFAVPLLGIAMFRLLRRGRGQRRL
jgi:hypothetical protein